MVYQQNFQPAAVESSTDSAGMLDSSNFSAEIAGMHDPSSFSAEIEIFSRNSR